MQKKKTQPRVGSVPLGRPATGKNPVIAIRWNPELLRGLDKYAHTCGLDRGNALRQIVRLYLRGQSINV